MTIDPATSPEQLMAYADGELDALAAKRVARAAAADPAIADQIAAHRRLRERLADGFAPVIAETPPDHLAALLIRPSTVVALPPPPRRAAWWPTAGAIAASLVIGVLAGQALRPSTPIASSTDGLYAAGDLARSLDTRLAAASSGSPVRIVASFRDSGGVFCRAFSGDATSGIACRSGERWALRRTASGGAAQATQYRQASSPDTAIMAEAQDMMAGAPLDARQEAAARDAGWR